MKARRWATLLCFAAGTVSGPALAQPRSGAPAPGTSSAAAPAETERQREAQEHFRRAKELYQAGSYREAIAELEVARDLDPAAKDLVMNLGIVHEKLGKFDEAVRYFEAYLDMDGVTPAERAKAEAIIKRIEGAKREVGSHGAEPPAATAPASAPVAAPPPERAPHGRVDALTVVAGSLAVAGLVAGTGVGIYALASRPEGFVTGRDGSYATLRDKTHEAHTAAIVADVSFGAGAAFALATAWLYFGRTKEAAPRSAASARARGEATAPRVSVAPASSGGVLLLDGSF